MTCFSRRFAPLAAAFFGPACGSANSPSLVHADAGSDSASSSGTMSDSGMEPTADSAPESGARTGDGGCAHVTVFNYMSRCSVSIAGMPASTSESQDFICVPAGQVMLSAKGVSGFQVWSGMWSNPSGTLSASITGNGAAAESATVLQTAPASFPCLAACCSSDGAGSDCPSDLGVSACFTG